MYLVQDYAAGCYWTIATYTDLREAMDHKAKLGHRARILRNGRKVA